MGIYHYLSFSIRSAECDSSRSAGTDRGREYGGPSPIGRHHQYVSSGLRRSMTTVQPFAVDTPNLFSTISGSGSPDPLARRGRWGGVGLRHQPRPPAKPRGVLARRVRPALGRGEGERVRAVPRLDRRPRGPLRPRARPGSRSAAGRPDARLARLLLPVPEGRPAAHRSRPLRGVMPPTRSTWSCRRSRAPASRTARANAA